MLIPGLPTAGAQQDIIKPKRTVQPTAETELLHEALEQVGERRRRDEGRYPERRRNRARRQAPQAESQRRSLGELPSKGLLVDIQV
ncbi:MAG: hypothetical protein ACK4VV_00735 [Pseudomonas sp.]